jgi:hypothetical protein
LTGKALGTRHDSVYPYGKTKARDGARRRREIGPFWRIRQSVTRGFGLFHHSLLKIPQPDAARDAGVP